MTNMDNKHGFVYLLDLEWFLEVCFVNVSLPLYSKVEKLVRIIFFCSLNFLYLMTVHQKI